MAQLKKILLVDDDDDLREALGEQLVMTEDFDVFEAGDGARRDDQGQGRLYDLVILDVGLPDTDGRELCRLMRKQGVKCPILMLTGHDSDADTILGLDAGANDYVTKPFKFPVLLARIRAQLRTHEQSEDAVFQLGPYTFRPAQKLLVTEDEKKVRLTEKETNILKFLYRASRGRGAARRAAARGLGLQCRRDDPHAGDAHLPAAPEDRARSVECAAAGDRKRRLPVGRLKILRVFGNRGATSARLGAEALWRGYSHSFSGPGSTPGPLCIWRLTGWGFPDFTAGRGRFRLVTGRGHAYPASCRLREGWPVLLNSGAFKMFGLRAIVPALAVAATLASSAAAQTTQYIRVQNHSGMTLVGLWFSAVNDSSWENDVLGSRVLRNGQYYEAQIRNVTNCNYDFRMQFSNGAVVTDVVNICNVSTYTINP